MTDLHNPIMESVLQIKKFEIVRDINDSYVWAKSEFSDQFEFVMKTMVEGIRKLQKDCKEGTSFFTAAWLMVLTKEPDASPEENIYQNKIVMASVGWVVFELWEQRYGMADPDRMVVFEDLFLI
jgi:hypothetical protein